jgi:hypothetical protein
MTAPDVRTVRVRFDGLCVSVESSAPEVLAEVERAFRAMVVGPPGGGDVDTVVATLSVTRLDDGYEISKSGAEAAERGPLAEVRRAIRYHTTRAFLEARTEWFWVHAAAARRGGRGVLLPGSRGSGKSTLVTALVRAGWRYLSDEAVPLDPASDRAVPFPLTPEVRMGPRRSLSREAVSALCKREGALDRSAICREPARITEIVFVRFAPGVSAILEPVTAGEAALQLLDGCLNFQHLGPRAVRYAAEAAGRLAARRLTFGDEDAAARLLDGPAGAAGTAAS